MSARTWTRAATAAGLVGMLTVAGVTGAASAAPPDPEATLDVMPGEERADAVQITDDAVYFISYDGVIGRYSESASLYRRALETSVDGTWLAPAELIGRVRTDAAYAVHEGTVAYVRAVDGRLVLRAPDGTETLPAWGDSEAMAGGVVDMSAEWLVVNDYPGEPEYTLVDRQTGAMYDLGDAVTVPPTVDWLADQFGVEISDTRAVFGMYSLLDSGGTQQYFTGVYTVALGADGPVGPATVLQQALDSGAEAATWVAPVGLDGTRALWTEGQCDTDDCTTVAHWVGAPYSGGGSSAAIGDLDPIGHDGSTLVVSQDLGDMVSRISWIDPTVAPGTAIRSVDLPGYVDTVHGALVAFRDLDHVTYLVDADGGSVTGDQSIPLPSMPFRDTAWDDAFTDEIVWLYDHGVVGGYDDRTYRPTASVNRDAMAAFLYRIGHDGADAPACTEAAFEDVPATHPFCGEISWLASTGITTGWPDGTFRPATPVTREAMAAFLYRFSHSGVDAPACAAAPFTDVVVANPFCGEIDWMADAGISTGWPDRTFRPAAAIERQAMAAFLFRFIDAGLVLN